MINHFRTYLLNRPAEFFTDSLFPVYIDPKFVPSEHTLFTRRVNNALFGEDADATLSDYRFFQFLRVIRSRDLGRHIQRFDSRTTYKENGEYDFTDPDLYIPKADDSALLLQEIEEKRSETMRVRLKVIWDRGDTVRVINEKTGAELRTVSEQNTEPSIPLTAVIPSLGLKLILYANSRYHVDYCRRPSRHLPVVIEDALSLSEDVYTSLFDRTREDTPEYEKGFRNVTDRIHRFCMLLFAQSVLLEKLNTSSV
jgi:hypothetical protein